MPQKIRWGIMGTGKISNTFADAVKASEWGEVVAVGSRRAETAEAFAAKHAIPSAFSRYRDVASAPGVDAIYVGTPHTVHRECVLAAAVQGKHVLCEKPMGITPRECHEMIDAARRSGVVLMEAFMYRVHPQTLRIRKMLADGVIGEVRTIRSAFTYGLGEGYNVRVDKDLRGGGLYDVGCYCINFSRMVAGEEPSKVEAIWTLGEETGVDENLSACLLFPSGVQAHFDVGIRSAGSSFAEIVGSEGRMVIPQPWKPNPVEAAFEVINRSGTYREVITNGGEIYALEADHLAAVVAGEIEPLIPAEDAVGNATVLDQIWSRIHG